jgi:hypothetical protein
MMASTPVSTIASDPMAEAEPRVDVVVQEGVPPATQPAAAAAEEAVVSAWREKLSADCYYCRGLGLDTGGGPNANMIRRYLGLQKKPCDRRCCHACQCGEILCKSCKTHIERTTRFVCMDPDCTPGQPDASTYGYRICEECFMNSDIMHPCPTDIDERPAPHQQFCKVTPDGVHTLASRSAGDGEIRELQIADFPFLVDEVARMAICECCQDPGGEDGAGLATYPNCRESSHGKFCRACLLLYCQSLKTNVYRGELADKPAVLFCGDCRKDAPIIKFREELLQLRALIDVAFTCPANASQPAEPELSAFREMLAAQGVPSTAVVIGSGIGEIIDRNQLDRQIATALKEVHHGQDDRGAVVDEVFPLSV